MQDEAVLREASAKLEAWTEGQGQVKAKGQVKWFAKRVERLKNR
jgi:hypothetical protein